jgi:hypothetical protein
MPTRPTLLDLATQNGNDAAAGILDEAAIAVPEITGRSGSIQIPNVGAARVIRGTSYKTLVRTALPSVGFRDANDAPSKSKGTYESRRVETYILNPRWECDQAVADQHEDGPEAYLAVEGAAVTQAALQHVAKQMYYGTGTGGDTKGFPGLLAAVNSTMVVDAGGTTDNVASSVWAVRFGVNDVQWVLGENGMLELKDPRIGDILDADGDPLTGYIQELLAYVGLQVRSTYSVGRIKKLTTDDGKGLTDARIASLLEKFRPGFPPDVLFMTQRSQSQLRSSRTATNPTGAPAPFPSEAFGIPIVVTESILNTEALTL